MKSPVLVGIKHCGKSTLGKLLASHYGCPFVDSDEELEKYYALRYHAPLGCREISRQHGGDFFRALEAEVIRNLISGEMRVLALGGGAASNPCLRTEDLKALGAIVWLDIADEIAFKRVIQHGVPPFLADAGDPAARFREINDMRRIRFAEIADHHFKQEQELDRMEALKMLVLLLKEENQK